MLERKNDAKVFKKKPESNGGFMNFSDIVTLMNYEGGKFRRQNWPTTAFIMLSDNGKITKEHAVWTGTIEDYTAKDWVPYNEPKEQEEQEELDETMEDLDEAMKKLDEAMKKLDETMEDLDEAMKKLDEA